MPAPQVEPGNCRLAPLLVVAPVQLVPLFATMVFVSVVVAFCASSVWMPPPVLLAIVESTKVSVSPKLYTTAVGEVLPLTVTLVSVPPLPLLLIAPPFPPTSCR